MGDFGIFSVALEQYVVKIPYIQISKQLQFPGMIE